MKPIQDSFYANLDAVNEALNKYWDKEDELIAMAQPMKNLANQILAVGGALLDDPITAEYNLTPEWEGETLRDLAQFMLDAGGHLTWHLSQGNIGPGGLIHSVLEGNVSTSHLLAAVIALDNDLGGEILGSDEYLSLVKAFALADMNWQYLLDLLQAYGLDPALVNDVETLVDDTEITPDDLDDDLYIATDDEGNDLLDPDTEWGENGETLQDLLDGLGDDPDAIWDDIEDLFTEMPMVPDVTGELLPAAETVLNGAGFVVGDITPMFDDLAPQGTVLDQAPVGGELAPTGSAVDLWVSAGANPCPEFFDDYGNSTFTIGGRAIADAIAQADTGGDLTDYYDYDAWDFDNDGVADSVMFDLLAHILCLPDTYEHPALGPVKPIQDSFYANLDAVNTVLNKYWDKEDEIIATAQPMKNLANQILAVGGALLDDPITPEYNLTPEWDGKTLGDLAQFMLDMGGDATWHLSQGNIGPGGLIHTVFEGNVSTAHLLAAVIALDNDLGGEILGSKYYTAVKKAFALVDLNWQYLIDLLQAYGLDPALVNEVETLVDDTEITPDDLDDDLYIATDDEGNDLLDPDTEWGEDGETLQDLLDGLGDDPDAIWDDIEDLFTEMPMVPDVTGELLPAAETVLNGAGFVVGDITPMFDDLAAPGTVLDQNPYGGELAPTGSAVDLWVCAGPNPCPEFFDDWGVSTFTIGGRAIADALQQGDESNDLTEYYNYDTWDFDEDGVPDSFMFDMLAHVLCLPDTYVHPAIGPVKPIQDAFYANLDAVNTFMDKYWDKEDAIVAVGPSMVDLANQILAVGGALLDEPITPEYNLTPEWDGLTLGDLAELMLDLGDGLVWNTNHGNIGPGGLVRSVLENNVSTAHLLAAAIALDDGLGGDILGSDAYLYALKAFALADLNWQYLIDLLQASGLDPVLVNEVEALVIDAGFNLDDLDDDLYIVSDENGNDLLDPNTEWGADGDTLQDLIDSLGTDPDAIWDEIEYLFNLPPVITLTGDAVVSIECGSVYVDAGATAVDLDSNDITASIVVGGDVVNTAVAGTYVVTYNVDDAIGRSAVEVTRTVNVIDTTPPVISLVGDANMSVECTDVYTEPGATALDVCEGDVAGIAIGGDVVNTGVLGVYTLTYNVSDSSANAATEVVRTVTVVDTTPPVIALVGDVAVTVECGDVYVDAGATALDSCEGDLSAGVVIGGDIVNTGAPGVYTLTYNVSDSSANAAAEVIRTVTVVDTTAPVLVLVGDATVNVECGGVYTDAGATATDSCGGDLTPGVVVGGDVVDTAVPGNYIVTYNVSDSFANAAAEISRTVVVVDAAAPVITLVGDALTVAECGDVYVDAGATAADMCEGDLTTSVIVGGDVVDTDVLGAYLVTYNVSDSSANAAAEVVRTVMVADTLPPLIGILGNTVVVVECNDTYVDGGAISTDECDGVLNDSIIVNGALIDTAVPGSYEVTYNVSDSASNAAVEVVRTVEVVDTTAPLITLLGDAAVTVACGDTYTDDGAVATDACEGDLSASITVGGDVVDTTTASVYTITYNVADSFGNAAVEVTRTVSVTDTIAPIISLVGDAAVSVECGDIYTDAGATASDGCEGDLSASVVVGGDVVDTAVAGQYIVTYNVSDSAANAAAEVTRTVTVVDTTAPVISLVGDAVVTVECGVAYADAGATAMDVCEGDVTASIIAGGAVDTNAPGSYGITYNVSDSAANAAAEVTRTVVVADTTAPTLLLAGNAAVNVECGSVYADAGATALDSCDGNLTANVVVGGDVLDMGTLVITP